MFCLCTHCQQKKPHHAHGMCGGCYASWRRSKASMAEKKAVLANKPRNLIPMGTKQEEKYTTQDELQFVKGIGNHIRDRSFYLDRSRLKILKFYRRSLNKRKVWGDLDKFAILQFVEEEIEREKLKNQQAHTRALNKTCSRKTT